MRKLGGLEYEEHGDGEAVLLVHGAIVADAMLPLAREPALADRHRLIAYRRRGYGASDPRTGGFSPRELALEAVPLLEQLGVERVHVAGDSVGGAVGLQLALEAPGLVHTLVALEPATIPAELQAVFPRLAAPVLDAYHAGDVHRAIDLWMGLVDCGPGWQGEVAKTVPGAFELAEKDGAYFLGEELPSLSQLAFDRAQAPIAEFLSRHPF